MNKIRNHIVVLFLVLFCSCTGQKFDKALWLNDDSASYPQRKSMADDLIQSHILVGKSNTEIVNLLGKDGSVDTTNTGKIQSISYPVLIRHGFDIDPRYWEDLQIRFDTLQQKTIRVEIVKGEDSRSFFEKIFAN
jgi:hypothetical protein